MIHGGSPSYKLVYNPHELYTIDIIYIYHKPNSYWTYLHLRVTYTSPLDVWGTSYDEDRTVTPERPARPPSAALDAPDAPGPSPSAASAAPAASGIKSGEPGSGEGSYADLF